MVQVFLNFLFFDCFNCKCKSLADNSCSKFDLLHVQTQLNHTYVRFAAIITSWKGPIVWGWYVVVATVRK